MRRIAFLAALCIGAIGLCAPVIAQPDNEYCSTPGLPISSTLPPAVDTINVPDSNPLGDLEVSVDVTHTFQGDIDIFLLAPDATLMQLHDQGGGSADNFDLIYSTNGVPNGSMPYDFGGLMQPAPNGLALLDVIGLINSDGPWELTVDDNIGGDDGVWNEWCIRQYTTGGTFPVGGLTCNPVFGTLQIDATWNNNGTYDAINIYIDGGLVTTLTGTDTAFTSDPQTSGTHTLSVEPVIGGTPLAQASCSVDTVITPVSNLTCSAVFGTLQIDASWTNPGTYDAINILIDGGLIATLAGDAVNFTSDPQTSGNHTLCVEGVLGGIPAPQTCCDVATIIDPVTDVTCTPNGDVVDVSWTNPGVFDAINIFVNGNLEETVGGGDTSYTTLPVAPLPAGVTVCVEGILAGTPAPQACCQALLSGTFDVDECSSPGLFISSTLPPTIDTLTVANGTTIGDVNVLNNITHTFQGDLEIFIASPSGTSVQLHDDEGGANDDLLIIWDDEGIPNGNPYNCACAMQPFQPLNALDNEPFNGDWTLTVTDTLGGDDGFLNTWCVLGDNACALMPPSGLTCMETGGDVDLMWTNNDTYDGDINVLRNGLVIATVADGTTSYTDAGAPAGALAYQVEGVSTTLGCGGLSNTCTILNGITDLLYYPAENLGGATDDAAGITTALNNNGVTGILQVDTLPADLSGFTRVWVVLGTFAINHQLDAAEGTTLRDYAVNNNGRLYVSGSDTWGFDPATDFDQVDGVDTGLSTDGSSACDISTLTGLDSTQGLNLDEFVAATATDNGGECAWIDHLVVDDGGNAMVNDSDGAAVVTYHDGLQSGTALPGDYRVICSSFEFSTFGDQTQRDALMAEYLGVFGGGGPPVTNIFRADCDGNGMYNGLVDGLAALNHQFVMGAPVPPCLDQCDFDNSNTFNGLVDGLGILNFQFVMGSPPPAAPGLMCGQDPDVLFDCANPTCP